MKNFFKKLFRKKISETFDVRKNHKSLFTEYIITITKTYSDGYVKKKEYIGSYTVWRTFPDFRRCSLEQEAELSDMFEKYMYFSNNK